MVDSGVAVPAVRYPTVAALRRRAVDGWARRPAAWALLAGLTTFGLLVFRNLYLFRVPIHEYGDGAANSILVDRAEHLQLLVGNYSREGFHHPGPAFLYVLAAGKAVFHDLLHVVPAPYNGEVLGGFVLAALLVALVVRTVVRNQPSLAVAVAVLAVVVAWTAVHVQISTIWFPDLYYAPFLLFAVAGASLAVGRTGDLPAFVLAGGLLVHGHVSFLMFVGVGGAAVLLAWIWTHRRGLRAELRGHRAGLIGSAALAGLFLLPMLLELALHWPGPWPRYLSYLNHRTHPNPFGASVSFAGQYWALTWPGRALQIGAGALAAGFTLFDRDRRRRRFVAALLGSAAVLTVLFMLYAVRGVDVLSDRYIGIFYQAVPLVVLIAAVVAVVPRVLGLLRGRWRRRASASLAAVAFAGAVVAGATGVQFTDTARGLPDLPSMVAAVQHAPARAGRPVFLTFGHDLWPQAVGFVLAAHRADLPVCIDNPTWTFMVTTRYICPARHAPGSAWTLALYPTWSVPVAGTVVWEDGDVALAPSYDPGAGPAG